MCGIAGILRLDRGHVQEASLRPMTNAIAHRGPDDEGYYTCGTVGLGHRRLSVIDPSLAGKQPMCNEDGTIWITYNGEVYNFKSIRNKLELRGHQFRSATDTEVVIHAYEEWGTDCLARFIGMFAFALWDGRKQSLWLVRDRLGVKPLFYAHLPDVFLFGSEIKALLSYPGFDRSTDYEALSYYLALNYTPAPHTLFAQVRQLLPGHWLMVDAEGNVQDSEYWDIVYREGEDRGDHAYLEEFRALLEDAIRLRLVSDVPFGAFLSGGVDSSSVVYWMSRHMPEPVKTFSIGFGETSFDELPYAREVAQKIGTDHYERVMNGNVTELLPQIVWHAEEPTADSSMIAVYCLAKLAREKVTMSLSGDGADEILGGYETYQAYYAQRMYTNLPRWLRRGVIEPLVNMLPVSDAKVSWDFKLRRFVRSADLSPEDAHATWRMIFNIEERARLLAPLSERAGSHADALDLYRSSFARTNARHPVNRMLYVDTRLYLPNDMLVKVDRMTMAHGLEARGPFLDHRLVEFCASVPPRLKLKNLHHKKYLLKKAMQGKLPERVLWRRKAGFNVPNARWIKQELKSFVTDHLSPARVHDMGLLEPTFVNTLLRDHFEQRSDNSHQIWCLLTLALWWQQFVDGKTAG